MYGQTGGTRTWYATDALGSVRHTLTNAGAFGAGQSFDPWGVPQTSLVTPFGFTGELQDAQGLTYLRARWYTAAEGRFGSRDSYPGSDLHPISLHLYAYAHNNPLLSTDPTGECLGWLWGDPSCQLATWEDVEQGNLSWEDARPWGGAALDLAPISGDVKGFIEVFTGCDLVTGEELGWWRYAGLVPLIGARARVGLRGARYVDDVVDVVEHYGDDVVDVVEHYGDDVVDLGGSSKTLAAGGSYFPDELKEPYIASGNVYGQKHRVTCVPASCRMILADNGILMENEKLLAEAMGISRKGMPLYQALDVLNGRLAKTGLQYEYKGGMGLNRLEESVMYGPAIVAVRDPGLPSELQSHAIIVDSIINGRVNIRDPYPGSPGNGSSYSIPTKIFSGWWLEMGLTVKH